MNNHADSDIKLWKPTTISWMTLIFGVASGFSLVAVNWCRLGLYKKAVVYLVVGILMSVLFAKIFYPFPYLKGDTMIMFAIRLILYLVVNFIIIMYLHKQTKEIYNKIALEGMTVKDAPLWEAILISAIVLAGISFFSPLIGQYVRELLEFVF